VQEGELITFAAWLPEYGELIEISEVVAFESLKKEGTMDHPVHLTLNGFTGSSTFPNQGFYIGNPQPNPFHDVTEIAYYLEVPAILKLKLINVKGQVMAEIANRTFEAGKHKLTIHKNDLPAGVYFYHIEIFNDHGTLQKNGKLIIRQ